MSNYDERSSFVRRDHLTHYLYMFVFESKNIFLNLRFFREDSYCNRTCFFLYNVIIYIAQKCIIVLKEYKKEKHSHNIDNLKE